MLLDIEELNRRAAGGRAPALEAELRCGGGCRRPLPAAAERRRARSRRRPARRRARAALAGGGRGRADRRPGPRDDGVPAPPARGAGARRRGRAPLRRDPRRGRLGRGRRRPDHPREPLHLRRARARGGRRSRRVVGGRRRVCPCRWPGSLRGPTSSRSSSTRPRPRSGASVEYAFANPEASRDYVRSLSHEMSDEVCAAHIALYVNESSVDIGDEGLAAIDRLLGRAAAAA